MLEAFLVEMQGQQLYHFAFASRLYNARITLKLLYRSGPFLG